MLPIQFGVYGAVASQHETSLAVIKDQISGVLLQFLSGPGIEDAPLTVFVPVGLKSAEIGPSPEEHPSVIETQIFHVHRPVHNFGGVVLPERQVVFISGPAAEVDDIVLRESDPNIYFLLIFHIVSHNISSFVG